jgi:hypothetical protein
MDLRRTRRGTSKLSDSVDILGAGKDFGGARGNEVFVFCTYEGENATS